MNNKLLAVIVIISSIGLLTVAIATTSPTTNVALAAGDKCISVQVDNGGTAILCSTNKQSPSLSGEAKKECRETGAKCSSSQTGFGEFGNFDKPNQ